MEERKKEGNGRKERGKDVLRCKNRSSERIATALTRRTDTGCSLVSPFSWTCFAGAYLASWLMDELHTVEESSKSKEERHVLFKACGTGRCDFT